MNTNYVFKTWKIVENLKDIKSMQAQVLIKQLEIECLLFSVWDSFLVKQIEQLFE